MPGAATAPADAAASELERLTPRNSLLNTLDGAGWHVALAFVSWNGIVPAFVAHSGGGPFLCALAGASWVAGVRLPQALSAWWSDGLARTRGLVLALALAQRVLVAGLAVIALTGGGHGGAPLAGFLIAHAAWCLATGLAYPAWVDFLARTLHPSGYGRALGIRSAVSNLAGVGAAAGAVLLLGRLPFPVNYAACFGLAALALALGFLPLARMRETERAQPATRPPFGEYLRSCFTLAGVEPGARRRIAALVLVSCMYAPASLYLAHGLERHGAGLAAGARDALAGSWTLAQTVALALTALPAGRAADRFGSRRVAAAGGAAGAAAALAALFAPGPASYATVFVLQGLAISAHSIGLVKLYMEQARGAARGRFMVLAEGAVVPVVLATSLGGGALVARTGWAPVFLACSALALAGAARLWRER